MAHHWQDHGPSTSRRTAKCISSCVKATGYSKSMLPGASLSWSREPVKWVTPGTAALRYRRNLTDLKVSRIPQKAPYTNRKSTRLNSSHGYISYAVFCLKKKKKN